MLRWRKSWIDENLEGSIRKDLLPAERSVWSDLVDLCGKSRRWGVIERSEGIPYTIEELAQRFVTPLEIVESAIKKSVGEGRLSYDGSGALVVTNWDKYQAVKAKIEDMRSQIPLSAEDKLHGQIASAARLGYLQPAAAERGFKAREIDEEAKQRNKDLTR